MFLVNLCESVGVYRVGFTNHVAFADANGFAGKREHSLVYMKRKGIFRAALANLPSLLLFLNLGEESTISFKLLSLLYCLAQLSNTMFDAVVSFIDLRFQYGIIDASTKFLSEQNDARSEQSAVGLAEKIQGLASLKAKLKRQLRVGLCLLLLPLTLQVSMCASEWLRWRALPYVLPVELILWGVPMVLESVSAITASRKRKRERAG